MRLETGDSNPPIMEPDDETIERVIRKVLYNWAEGEVAILLATDDPHNYIQTTPDTESTCLVEYRDSSMAAARHYRMDFVPVNTVITIFQSYRHGHISWKNDFPWQDVTTEYDSLPAYSTKSDTPSSNNLASNTSLGVVYLLKSGPFFKIGKSVNFEQRFSQIKLQLPYPTEVLHQIETDDISGIEYYWHKRFASKRANGEWFLLTEEDVRTFKSRTKM